MPHKPALWEEGINVVGEGNQRPCKLIPTEIRWRKKPDGTTVLEYANLQLLDPPLGLLWLLVPTVVEEQVGE